MLRASRPAIAALLVALLPVALTGCLFEQPLTAPSNVTSPNIDTRLLGVFEMREKGAKPGDPDKIHRVAVLPESASPLTDTTMYRIYYRDFTKKPAKVLMFRGWLSRVGTENFLSIEDLNPGETAGKFGFFRYEWEFPGNIMLSAPDLTEATAAKNPYQVRKALRAKLKAGTAFPYQATYWKKIARIWWDPKNPEPIDTVPPEFEKGTTIEKPAL